MPQIYSSYKPTKFDSHINIPEQEDWLVLPINKPANTCDILTEANFQSILSILDKADPSGELYEEHTFNHWAQAFTIILAHPSLLETVTDIENRLERYPILDEELHSSLELDDLIESFNSWGKLDFARIFQETFECSDTLRDFLETNLTIDFVDLLNEQDIHPQFTDSDRLYTEMCNLIQSDRKFDRQAAATWIKQIRNQLKQNQEQI